MERPPQIQATPPRVPATPPPPLLHHSGHPQSDINLAMWCHLIPVLTGFIGFGLFGFLGPLIIRQNNPSRSAYVDQHARESLNFQLSVLLYVGSFVVVSIAVIVFTLGFGFFLLLPGFLLLGLAGIGILVMEIIATIKATKGEHFDYLISIKFFK